MEAAVQEKKLDDQPEKLKQKEPLTVANKRKRKPSQKKMEEDGGSEADEYEEDNYVPEKSSKKRAPKTAAKARTPKGGLPGVSKEDFENTKEDKAKKVLNTKVKIVAKMVDDDWHDGYEEQGEELVEYVNLAKDFFQAVCNVGIEKDVGHDRCHQVMKVIADTWDNMNTIPMRGGIKEGFECELELSVSGKKESFPSIQSAISYVWRRLLCSAVAKGVDEATMFQYIKDSVDNGTDIDGEDEDPDPDSEVLKRGYEKLKALYNQKEKWTTLPTTKKFHKERRCIDRRFDGPKERRTRDFSHINDYY